MTQTLAAMVGALGSNPLLAALVVFLAAFGEALLIVGAFVPTTVVLVGLGALIGAGQMAFLPVFGAAVAGAAAGDALSFWAGVHWKGRIRTVWPFSAHASLLTRGEGFMARHGGKSILIARFVPGVKAVVPILAGSMGMGVAWFTTINVASGVVWVAAQMVPAITLGRGLQVSRAANPRAMILAGLLVAAILLAWLLARLAAAVLVPAADAWRERLVARLDGRTGPGARRARRLLAGGDGGLAALALALAVLAALAGMAALVTGLLFGTELALSDAAVSGFVQTLRTPWATSAMVAVTMLGDGAVLTVVALLLVGLLAAYREWRLAALVAAAGLAGAAAVPLLKTLLHRARPIVLGDGAQAFSFPSGHSTLATIILGTLALFVARAVPDRFRLSVYGAFAVLIALIAASRVYLQAHWPSDVAAGLLLGGAVVMLVALASRRRPVAVPGRAYAALLAVLVLGVAPLHLWRGYAAAQASYDVQARPVALAQGDWLGGGWHDLPQARVLLDGDPGEPMILQTDLALGEVVDVLRAAGWRPRADGLSGELLAAVLPARGALMERPPWPMTHLGRPAVATLVRPDPGDPARRNVLRVWATDRLVEDGATGRPLLTASVTTDRLDPIALGWSLLEEEGASGSAAAPGAAVAGLLPGPAVRPAGGPALVAAPPI